MTHTDTSIDDLGEAIQDLGTMVAAEITKVRGGMVQSEERVTANLSGVIIASEERMTSKIVASEGRLHDEISGAVKASEGRMISRITASERRVIEALTKKPRPTPEFQ